MLKGIENLKVLGYVKLLKDVVFARLCVSNTFRKKGVESLRRFTSSSDYNVVSGILLFPLLCLVLPPA